MLTLIIHCNHGDIIGGVVLFLSKLTKIQKNHAAHAQRTTHKLLHPEGPPPPPKKKTRKTHEKHEKHENNARTHAKARTHHSPPLPRLTPSPLLPSTPSRHHARDGAGRARRDGTPHDDVGRPGRGLPWPGQLR